MGSSYSIMARSMSSPRRMFFIFQLNDFQEFLRQVKDGELQRHEEPLRSLQSLLITPQRQASALRHLDCCRSEDPLCTWQPSTGLVRFQISARQDF